MTRLLMVAIVALTPVLSFADEPKAPDAPAPPAAEIAVVKTWDDLAERPPIQLPEGPTVRVGVEANTITPNGGVLVYLLLEGDKWARGGHRGVLGPLKIEVETEQKRELEHVKEQLLRQVQNAEWAGAERLLFVATIPHEPGGALAVSLMHGAERVVAKTKLAIAEEPMQSWFAFDGAAHRNRIANGEEFVSDIVPDLSRSVVPKFAGDRPFDWVRKGDEAERGRKLPGLIPTEGPTITLAAKRVGETHELIVKLPEQVMSSAIAQNLAARWWIDGEPVLTPLAEEQEELQQHANRFVRSNQLRLKLDIPDGSFGKFGGERIEVELMYCPDGAIDTSDSQQRLMQQMFVHGQKQRGRAPVRSNRAAFTLPHKFALR